MEEKNTLANVAIGAGAGVWVLFVIQGCLGCIPIVNMFAMLLFPVVGIASVVAIVCGFLGMRRANELGGLGKGQAIGGLVLGVAYWLLTAGMVALMIAMGGLSMVLQMLGG